MKMAKLYKAAFLIPVGAVKILDETGWLFTTTNWLSQKVVDSTVQLLSLNFKESYLDTDVYVGSGIKMSAIKNSKGEVEHLYFQLTTMEIEEFKHAFSHWEHPDADLFVP